MKQILMIFLVFSTCSIFAQVRPDNFTEDITPSATDAFYTQEAVGGIPTPRKIKLSKLKTFYAADVTLTPVGYTPTATGNGTNLISFVIDPNQDTYYIDGDGNSILVQDSVYISNDTLFWEDYNIKIPAPDSTVFSTLYALQDTAAAIRGDFHVASIVDSTRLVQDSILVYYQSGAEVGRDTITGTGGGGLWSTDANGIHNTALTNVGAGINLPTGRLHVKGSGATSATFAAKFENSASTSLMAIRDDGRVGIGLTNPSYSLDVKGDVHINNASNQMFLYGGGNSFLFFSDSGGSYFRRLINGSISWRNATNNELVVLGTTNGVMKWNNASFAEGMRWDAPTASLGVGINAPTARLHVKGSGATSATDALSIVNSAATSLFHVEDGGNVGIGTTTPLGKLQVTGGSIIQDFSTYHLWGGAVYGAGTPTISGDVNGFHVYPNGSTSGETFTIDDAGEVGIGTITPGYKLEVVGTFKMGDATRYIEQTATSLYQKYVSGANVTTAGIDPGGSFDIDVTDGTAFSNFTNTTAGIVISTSDGTDQSALTHTYKGTEINGQWIRSGFVTGSITANSDNFTTAGLITASHIKFALDAAWNITGISATDAVEGTEISFQVDGGALTLKHNVTSTAANRFDLSGDADIVIGDGGGGVLRYDATLLRWKLIAVNQ